MTLKPPSPTFQSAMALRSRRRKAKSKIGHPGIRKRMEQGRIAPEGHGPLGVPTLRKPFVPFGGQLMKTDPMPRV